MRRHVVSLVSIAVGAFGGMLAACSSNNGSGTASTSSEFADQYCSYIATCCGAESYPSDGKQCRTLLAYENGTYNAQAGNACIAAVQAASQKDPAWCVDNVDDTNSACDPAFGKNGGGGVQPGGKCQSTSDCASPPAGDEINCRNYYDFNTQASTDICQVFVPGKPGDGPCLGTETKIASGTETTYNDDTGTDGGGAHPSQGFICRVADGVSCQGNGADAKCVALAQIGDDCSGSTGSSSCAGGAYCDFSTEKCVAQGNTGDTCSASSGASCVTGDYCDSTSLKCTVALQSGAACTSSQQCASDDCTNGKCGAGFASLGLGLLCGNPVGDGG